MTVGEGKHNTLVGESKHSRRRDDDERRPLVFSTERYDYLADSICTIAGYSSGRIERDVFPDGERYYRLVTPVAGREVVIVAGTVSDADTLEIFDVACSVVDYGAERLTLVLPYFGYSTMERAVYAREAVTAKNRARLLSAIPSAARGNRVVLVDLHSEGLPYYFEGAIDRVHLYCKKLIAHAARRAGGEDFVMACTDAGRAKWVESLANDLGVPAAFVFKRRLSGDQTEVAAVSAYVENKPVVIYDDMIRTGGSLINAARAYKDAGATSIVAITTHGLFSRGALDRIADSALFDVVVACDTHPCAHELREHPLLEVISVADLLADFLSGRQDATLR